MASAADLLRDACRGFRTGNISQADASMQKLRESPTAIPVFLSAIETLGPSDNLECFHAVLGLQHAALKRWQICTPAEKAMLRDYLLHIGLTDGMGRSTEGHNTSAATIPFEKGTTNAALAASAVLWKR